MNDLEQMLDLLAQKRAYYLRYEKEMEAIPLLPAEELEPCILRGAAILEKIGGLDSRLNQLVQQNGPLARSAVNHECDRGQLDPALGSLYDAARAVKAVASRILANDGMIKERIAIERDKAMEKIVALGSSPASVAGKYQRHTRPLTEGSRPAWQHKEA